MCEILLVVEFIYIIYCIQGQAGDDALKLGGAAPTGGRARNGGHVPSLISASIGDGRSEAGQAVRPVSSLQLISALRCSRILLSFALGRKRKWCPSLAVRPIPAAELSKIRRIIDAVFSFSWAPHSAPSREMFRSGLRNRRHHPPITAPRMSLIKAHVSATPWAMHLNLKQRPR